MSFVNDITTAVGFRQPYAAGGQQPTLGTGQQPGGPNAAQQLSSRFGTVFSSEFSGTLQAVIARGSAGEFDDASLRQQEQDAMERLRRAQVAAAPATTPGTGATSPGAEGPGATNPGTGSPTTGGIGGETAPATSGGGAAAGPAEGANAAPATSDVGVAEQREVYDLRVRQSEARLQNVSASLVRDFPLGAAMESASSGRWDPETFVPQTREQAEALAQRLVIDATEAAARLDILEQELTAAKFELTHGGGERAAALVRQLEQTYERQDAWVRKLATVVNRLSGGQVTDAGEDARAGRSMRGAGDMPVEEFVASMRAKGKSEEEITLLVGALEMPVEQEKTPGGSTRLKTMASEMTRTLLADFNRRMDRMREERTEREEQRREERRLDDKRHEAKRADQAAAEAAAIARQEQRDADWQAWINQLAAKAASERRAG